MLNVDSGTTTFRGTAGNATATPRDGDAASEIGDRHATTRHWNAFGYGDAPPIGTGANFQCVQMHF